MAAVQGKSHVLSSNQQDKSNVFRSFREITKRSQAQGKVTDSLTRKDEFRSVVEWFCRSCCKFHETSSFCRFSRSNLK